MYDLCLLCLKFGTNFTLRKPRSSLLCAMQQINFLATLRGVQKMRFDYCQFGALWKKPNTMLVFGDSNFKRHESICASYCKNDKFPNCGVLHVRLSGHDKNTNGQCYFRTWIAEPYPEQFCSEWARLITDDYTTRTNSLPSSGPHHGHKLKWSDLDIDVAGLPIDDRPVLFLVEAYHNNRLKASSPPPPSHYLTHFPKHPGCETCIRTKTIRKQHRR